MGWGRPELGAARLTERRVPGRANKSDVNDAEGLAWLALTGWYRRVVAKSETARIRRSLLVARAQLCGQRRAAERALTAMDEKGRTASLL